jgi:hypothetical protein
VEILVLSEDRGQGFETIAALLRRLLLIYGPRGELLLKLVPTEERTVAEAAHANLWKSSSNQDHYKKVSLRRAIATKLKMGGVVVFHYDGDTIWADRADSTTPNQFERELRVPLRQLLTDSDSSVVESRMARLIEVTPHYSIEAWTYQATDQAIGICRSKYSGRDIGKFQQWAAERGALDEVAKPKEETCLGNKHNEELASCVPCKEVLAIGKSLAELLRRLQACPVLSSYVRSELSA